MLDASELGVDELGEPLSPTEVLSQAQAGLTGVDRALAAVDDAFDPALAATSRLFRQRV